MSDTDTSVSYQGEYWDLDYCQNCGLAFSTYQSGWIIDTNDVEGTGENARLFRQDAEHFGEWQGFEEEDIGAWCDHCSYILQNKRTQLSRYNPTEMERGESQ